MYYFVAPFCLLVGVQSIVSKDRPVNDLLCVCSVGCNTLLAHSERAIFVL